MTPERLLEHDDFVRALARSLLLDGGQGGGTRDDVAQQAWLHALVHPPTDESALPSFLRRCVERVAIDFSRSSRARVAREMQTARVAARESVPSPAEIVAREEARRRVVAALLALDPALRDAIVLRFYEGLPPRHIAARLRIPAETARTRVKRGLEKLRVALDSEYGGDGRGFALALAPLARLAAPAALVSGVTAVKLAIPAAAIALAAALWILVASQMDDTASSDANVEDAVAANAPVGGRAELATAHSAPPRDASGSTSREAAPGSPEPRDTRIPDSIVGRVVDVDGRPVVGARVATLIDASRAAAGSTDSLAVPREGESTETDSTGRFALAPATDALDFSLVATHPGFAPTEASSIRRGQEVALVLESARRCFGRVIDEAGNGVAAARVRWIGLLGDAALERTSTSREDGSFELADLPAPSAKPLDGREGLGMLWVDAAGFAPLALEIPAETSARSGDVELTVVVDHGGVVTGEVVAAETGEPLAGVAISIESALGEPLVERPFERPRAAPWNGARLGEAVTDAAGRFEVRRIPAIGFHDLPLHEFTTDGAVLGFVVARMSGRASASANLLAKPRGETARVKLTLERAATIEGRVVDASGAPQEGVLVAAQTSFAAPYTWHYADSAPSGYEIACTDREGRYRLEKVPADAAITPRRVFAQRPYAYSQAEVTVDARAGHVATAPDLVLSDDPVARLRVVDSENRPIVHARAASDDQARRTRFADREGRIHIPVDPEGRPRVVQRVRIEAAGFTPFQIEEVPVVATDAEEIVVTLSKALALSGRVRFADGSPAAYARVVALAGNAPVAAAFAVTEDLMALTREGRLPALWKLEETRADSRGRFTLNALPDAALHVAAGAIGFDATERTHRFASTVLEAVHPSATAIELSIPLEGPRHDGVAIEGTIRDADSGELLADFDVVVTRDGTRLTAERVAPGRFRVRGLEPGNWKLNAHAKGRRGFTLDPLVIPADVPLPPLDLALDRGAVARGRVIGPRDDDLSSAMIRFLPLDRGAGEPTEIVRVHDGRYEVAGLTPGRWRPLVLFSIRYQAQKSFTVPADRVLEIGAGQQDAEFDIEAIVGGTLVFELRDDRLPPASWMKKPATRAQLAFAGASALVVEDLAGRVFYAPARLENGSMEWFDLPAGEYRLRRKLGGDDEIVKPFTVVAGKSETMQ